MSDTGPMVPGMTETSNRHDVTITCGQRWWHLRAEMVATFPTWLSLPAVQGYRTSRPVTARPMIMRWISEVPSKMVKILASRCQRSTGYSRV
jgi:hypothetical protein